MWSVPISTGTSVRAGDCSRSATRHRSVRLRHLHARLLEAVPERLDSVEHLVRALEELLLVEAGAAVGVDQLGHGVRGMLVLDAVVPGEERESQFGALTITIRVEALDELLPEARRRPVLDRERR